VIGAIPPSLAKAHLKPKQSFVRFTPPKLMKENEHNTLREAHSKI